MGVVVVDPMPYVSLLAAVDVLRFVAVFAIVLLSWIAFVRTRASVFAFTSAGFSAMLLAIVSRHLAIGAFNQNALCLGCLGLGSFYAYYYISISLMVIGASLVALAYVKRFSWIAVLVSSVLLLIAVRLALVSTISYTAVLAIIFGFIALRAAYSIRRSKRAVATSVAFAALATSYVLESFVYVSPWFYPVGEVFGLFGFVVLATTLMQVWLS